MKPLRLLPLVLPRASVACHRLFERKCISQKPEASDHEFDFDDALAIDRK